VSLVISLYNKIKLHIKSTEYKSCALYFISFFEFTSFSNIKFMPNNKFLIHFKRFYLFNFILIRLKITKFKEFIIKILNILNV
jgi:hypothetical protein